MNTLEVFITERVMGGNYCNNRDCPLYRALKDQHPNLDFDYIGGHGRVASDKLGYFNDTIFEPSDSTPWCSDIHDELRTGERQYPYRILLESVK